MSAPRSPRLAGTPKLGAPRVGDKVLVNNSLKGTVRFVGETKFASGIWVGVELPGPGKLISASIHMHATLPHCDTCIAHCISPSDQHMLGSLRL